MKKAPIKRVTALREVSATHPLLIARPARLQILRGSTPPSIPWRASAALGARRGPAGEAGGAAQGRYRWNHVRCVSRTRKVKEKLATYVIVNKQPQPEGTMVIMTCFTADFDESALAPANEIEELKWIGSAEAGCVSATSALILQDLKAKGLID